MPQKTELTNTLAPHKLHTFKIPTLLFLLGSFIVLHSVISLYSPSQTHADDLTQQNIIAAINKERATRNLLTLNENSLLRQAAQYKADDMQARHYFAHVDPDGHYIWDKITSLGYSPYVELGENLAVDFYDTQSLVDAWMQSPTHRANILNNSFHDQGMGINLGNTQENQYHSAIANTFGTLLTKTQPAATPKPSASAPVVVKTTPVKTKLQASTPTPPPAAVTAPAPTTSPLLVAARGTASPGYQLPQQTQPTSTVPTSTTNTTTSPLPASTPYIPQIANSSSITSHEINRYLSLFFGLLILLFLGSDILTFIKQRTDHLDKKVNNFVLLILSLIVVGLLYWL
jgi:hypothetical protein